MKKCPYCAEEIQDEAIFCRWCNHDLPTSIFQVHPANTEEILKNQTPIINTKIEDQYNDSALKPHSSKKYLWIVIIGLLMVVIYLFFNANANLYTSKSTDRIKSEDYYFLLQQYSRFTNLYSKLNESQALGANVKDAYVECMDVISTLKNYSKLRNSNELKIQLVDGISAMCKGFGCYSNSSLCKSDAEATQLLTSGNRTLEKFLNNMNFLQSSRLITP